LVVPTNIALAITTIVGRISPLPFVVNGENLKKFNELNLKRWQYKILFYMTTLNYFNVLGEKSIKVVK
jgi:hypothetical protein